MSITSTNSIQPTQPSTGTASNDGFKQQWLTSFLIKAVEKMMQDVTQTTSQNAKSASSGGGDPSTEAQPSKPSHKPPAHQQSPGQVQLSMLDKKA